jgi:hypothetical protein
MAAQDKSLKTTPGGMPGPQSYDGSITDWVLSTGHGGAGDVYVVNQPATQPVTVVDGGNVAQGAKADAAATDDTGTWSLIALVKRLLQKWTAGLDVTDRAARLMGHVAVDSGTVTANIGTTGALALDGTDTIGVTPPTGASGIRGWLSALYNLFFGGTAKVQATITGRNLMESYEVIAAAIATFQDEQVLAFQSASPMQTISIINDGPTDARVALNQKVVKKYDQEDAKFTYTGTWGFTTGSTAALYGGSARENANTNTADNTVFNPGEAVKEIGLMFLAGQYVGIASVQLSSDGATWLNPTSIPGVTRSDGATANAMNTYDAYVNSGAVGRVVSYRLPYTANWRIRVTATNTKNASALGQALDIDGGYYEPAYGGITIKSGEVFKRDFQTSSVHYISASGAPSLRIEAER